MSKNSSCLKVLLYFASVSKICSCSNVVSFSFVLLHPFMLKLKRMRNCFCIFDILALPQYILCYSLEIFKVYLCLSKEYSSLFAYLEGKYLFVKNFFITVGEATTRLTFRMLEKQIHHCRKLLNEEKVKNCKSLHPKCSMQFILQGTKLQLSSCINAFT